MTLQDEYDMLMEEYENIKLHYRHVENRCYGVVLRMKLIELNERYGARAKQLVKSIKEIKHELNQ